MIVSVTNECERFDRLLKSCVFLLSRTRFTAIYRDNKQVPTEDA